MKTLKKQKSQIAIIITFVIAVIILLAAVFINIAKVGQVKLTVSQAADKAALSLASQLGSMSHAYREKALDGEGEEVDEDGETVLKKCDIIWKPIVMFIIALVTFIAYFTFPPALLIGALLAFVVNSVMVGGISEKFREMTSFNAMRESTLFQALASIQTDDVQLKAIEPGKFCENVDGDDICERTYNLGTGMPDMLNQPKVDRFSAWYYWNRLYYMREADKALIEERMQTFIYGNEITARSGLMRYISVDSTKPWGDIEKLSYVLVPGIGNSGGNTCMEDVPVGTLEYNVTCEACPDWVKDPATDEIWMARLDAEEGTYDGFLKDKLKSLLIRLEYTYGDTYCDGCPIKPQDMNNLIKDMGQFLARTRELANMAATQRMNNVAQWIRAFYDFEKHKPAGRTSYYDTHETPCEDFNEDPEAFNDHYSHDIYLRLWRDRIYIQSWIPRLEALNTIIKEELALKHGECTWGRGPGVSSTCASAYGCSTENCGCTCCCSDDCSGGCCCCYTCCWFVTNTVSPCAWEGIYNTCNQAPVVCSVGDLYTGIPGWCSTHADQAGCHSNCQCDVNNFVSADPEQNFQGQLAWDNTAGPTEVEQALAILRSLQEDFAFLQLVISPMADAVASLLDSQPAPGSSGDLARNEIVYAWKDKRGFSHLAAAKIEGYPTKLPYVTEKIEWGGLRKCRVLHSYAGELTITTSRYDQDQPTAIADWSLRRRRQVDTPDLDVATLEGVVEDIQDNAVIDTHEGAVEDILSNHVIRSSTQAFYGTEKSDIYINYTEGD